MNRIFLEYDNQNDNDRWEESNALRLLFPRRFYAVTSRRYNTASFCSNSISRSVKLKHQQQQQQHTSQLTTRTFKHPDNSDIIAAAAERQYFELETEQQ